MTSESERLGSNRQWIRIKIGNLLKKNFHLAKQIQENTERLVFLEDKLKLTYAINYWKKRKSTGKTR